MFYKIKCFIFLWTSLILGSVADFRCGIYDFGTLPKS